MNEFHSIDFEAMVLEVKPWPRSPKVFKAILGLNFQEVKTVGEIKKIFEEYEKGAYPYGDKPTSGVKKESAYYRWLDLSQEAIDKADDFPKAQKAWEEAPKNSYVKEKGLIKMLEFSNKKQTKGIFFGAPDNSLARRKAVEKLTTFFKIN